MGSYFGLCDKCDLLFDYYAIGNQCGKCESKIRAVELSDKEIIEAYNRGNIFRECITNL